MRVARPCPPWPAAGALLLLLALAGCAMPAGGVKGWRALRTPSFELKTDVGAERAREIAQDLEALHGAIASTLFSGLPPEPRPITVVAFDSPLDYERYAPFRQAAAYFTTDVQGNDVIVMPSTWAHLQRTYIAHELGHHFQHRAFLRQPHWFAEGLATYLESLAPVDRSQAPTLGGVPNHVAARLRLDATMSYVLTARRLDAHGYAHAWTLVHFLINSQPARFDAYTERLARGSDPAAAWREIFPEWDPAVPAGRTALDRMLQDYLEGGQFRYGTVARRAPVAVAERPMAPPEVRELRFGLPRFGLGGTPPRDGLRGEAEAALADDPGHVGALWVLAFLEPKRAGELGGRAVAAHPEDDRGWLLVAEGAPKEDAEGRERSLRRAVEVAPRSPRALMRLSAFLLDAGRSGEALPLLRTATAEAPRNWGSQLLLATALEDLGRCAQAVAALERALGVLGDGVEGPGLKAIEERHQALLGRCPVAP